MKRHLISKILRWLGIIMLVFIAFVIYSTWLKPVKLEHLKLETLNGDNVNLDSLFAGKHTVLNFWATWCKPCIEEMPMLDSVYSAMDKSKWQILLISDEPIEKINAFKARNSYSMSFYKLSGKNADIGIAALPKTIVIDEEMKVLWSKTGGLTSTAEEMREMLLGL